MTTAWRVRWSAALAQSGRESVNHDSIRPRSSTQIRNRWNTLSKAMRATSTVVPVIQTDTSSASTLSTPALSQSQQISSIIPADTATTLPLPVLDNDNGYEITIPITVDITPSANGESLNASITKKKRSYEAWTQSASNEFSMLYDQHCKRHCGSVWSYNEFTSVWDAEVHGVVTQSRWKRRNQTQKDRQQRLTKQ